MIPFVSMRSVINDPISAVSMLSESCRWHVVLTQNGIRDIPPHEYLDRQENEPNECNDHDTGCNGVSPMKHGGY